MNGSTNSPSLSPTVSPSPREIPHSRESTKPSPYTPRRWGYDLSKALGSLKLAVLVILGLAITLATATFLETSKGTRFVQEHVYGSLWFTLLLFFLAANIFFSAALRFPWKKHQAGFVVAHTGILILLFGGFLTRQYGIDGSLALNQGETGSFVSIDERWMEAWDQKNNRWLFRGAMSEDQIQTASAQHGPLHSTVPSWRVLEYLPQARPQTGYVASKGASSGFPAILLNLDSAAMGVHQQLWLTNDPRQPETAEMTLGLAKFRYVHGKRALTKTQTPHRSEVRENVLLLRSEPKSDVFSYQITRAQTRSQKSSDQGILKRGMILETGWRDIKVTVQDFIPAAERKYHFLPVPEGSNSSGDPQESALLLQTTSGPQWIGYGDSVESEGVLLRYGPRLVSLPFAIRLDQFKKETYPGTNRAKSYASQVHLLSQKQNSSHIISMNEPLQHEGFTFYQASYQETPTGVVSVFSVSLDPGRSLKYFGSLLIVLGILIMYTQRRWLGIRPPHSGSSTTAALAFFLCLLCGAATTGHTASTSSEALRLFGLLPIQNGGRIKPIDSFAREAILSLTEKRAVSGEAALEQLLRWTADPETAWKQPVLTVQSKTLKSTLGLSEEQKYFSPESLSSNATLKQIWESAQRKANEKQKLSHDEQSAQRVVQKLEFFAALTSRQAWSFVPFKDTWASPLDPPARPSGLEALFDLLLRPYGPTQREAGDTKQADPSKLSEGSPTEASDKASTETSAEASAEAIVKEFASRQAMAFIHYGAGKATDLMPMGERLKWEANFNRWRPFQKSYLLYFLAFALFFISFRLHPSTERKWSSHSLFRSMGWGAFLLGFAVHTAGFGVRCWLTGHPPVTNMYESTIWVPWGVIAFGLILAVLYRRHGLMAVVPAASSLVAALSLLLSDAVPAVLDPSIKPLEAVLRSNYWLTIHVLTITLSYAAFALSLGLANLTLGYYAWKPRSLDRIAHYTQFMYKAIQFGVILLAAGTILGGVWADYSWGRFWGWDPKEIWALTALLMYLALLHGRWSGWLKPFGIVVGTILCFSGVLMAWYGVNFVLGVGLHSYGFVSGGLTPLAGFMVIQALFVALALGVRRLHRSP